MVWQQYVLGAWLILGALAMISQVGKARKPIEPGAAVLSVILTGLFLWLIASIPVDA